ncbi:MAG TPA: hypothetical protein VGT24_12035 [Candidatus Acidoferrales bacterium]|nr:hypothetical protein [Candidatus Acidoferrales bacterium]
MRIFVVSEAKEALRLRRLLELQDSKQFQMAHAEGLDLAAKRLARISHQIEKRFMEWR